MFRVVAVMEMPGKGEAVPFQLELESHPLFAELLAACVRFYTVSSRVNEQQYPT